MNHHDFTGKLKQVDGIVFDPEHDTRYAIQGYSVDFKIGGIEPYPSGLSSDLPAMIHTSSVVLEPEGDYSIRARDDMPEEFPDVWHAVCTEARIHLPPYRHDQQNEIESYFDLPDEFFMHYGSTRGFGNPNPPHWGLTPHIHLTDEPCSCERLLRVIRQAANLFRNVDYMTSAEIKERLDRNS